MSMSHLSTPYPSSSGPTRRGKRRQRQELPLKNYHSTAVQSKEGGVSHLVTCLRPCRSTRYDGWLSGPSDVCDRPLGPCAACAAMHAVMFSHIVQVCSRSGRFFSFFLLSSFLFALLFPGSNAGLGPTAIITRLVTTYTVYNVPLHDVHGSTKLPTAFTSPTLSLFPFNPSTRFEKTKTYCYPYIKAACRQERKRLYGYKSPCCQQLGTRYERFGQKAA